MERPVHWNKCGMYGVARRWEGGDGDWGKENGVGTNGRRSRWGLAFLSGKF